MVIISNIDSPSEMKEVLRRKKARNTNTILLGEDSEVKSISQIITVTSEDLELVIGVVSEFSGGCKCLQIGNSILVGYNKEIDIIRGGEIVKRIMMSSCFEDFYYEKEIHDSVIALFEIEVCRVSLDGSIIWRYYVADIIADISVKRKQVDLKTFENSQRLSIDIDTGRRLS